MAIHALLSGLPVWAPCCVIILSSWFFYKIISIIWRLLQQGPGCRFYSGARAKRAFDIRALSGNHRNNKLLKD